MSAAPAAGRRRGPRLGARLLRPRPSAEVAPDLIGCILAGRRRRRRDRRDRALPAGRPRLAQLPRPARPRARSCSGPPATSTSTAATACTGAPTWSASPRAAARPCCSAPSRRPHGLAGHARAPRRRRRPAPLRRPRAPLRRRSGSTGASTAPTRCGRGGRVALHGRGRPGRRGVRPPHRHLGGRRPALALRHGAARRTSPSPSRRRAVSARRRAPRRPGGRLPARRTSSSASSRSGRPLRVKLGVDPTAPDIHLGHTVVLGKLREFQDAGHTGGADHRRLDRPGGRSLGPHLDAARCSRGRGDRAQRRDLPRAGLPHPRPRAHRDPRPTASGSPAWAWSTLFRLAGSATVNQLLRRNDFAERMGADRPVSVLELLYPLMQAYDSVDGRGGRRARAAPTSSST